MKASISCIIPAYNEEKSIETTLKTLLPLLGNQLAELIIINDHSSDQTAQIITPFSTVPGITILHNPQNLGKSASVARGIELAKGDFILLLDADLLYLTADNIKSLIAPVKSGKVGSSIAFIKNSRPLRPFKKIDYCNGQRVLPTALLKSNLHHIAQLRGYGLEVFLNKLQIQHQISLASVHRNNVENDFHQNRDGFRKGGLKSLKIWRHIISCAGGLRAIYKMNYDLEKLLQK